ncbi:MAG: hotdog domain-containing protein [Pseudomonadota bacterium]
MNPDLDDLNRKYVARTPHMLDTGMRVTALEPGRGTMTMPARPDWVGDPVRHVLHPGALTVLADSACGLAVGAALPKRVPYATLDLRMDYLRPAGPGHDLHCEAHCYRLTRSVAFVRADVWQADRAQPIATAQATFMLSTPAGTPRPRPGAADAPAPAPSPATAPDPAGWRAPADSLAVLPGSPIPYVEYLGIRMAPGSRVPLFRLPYQDKLIGNPDLPALHGGVIAGFAETAALLHLVQSLQGAKLPKGIDFSIDYLRAGRPVETFAECELVRVGARVALVQVRCWQSSPDNPIVAARGHFLLTAAEGLAAPA